MTAQTLETRITALPRNADSSSPQPSKETTALICENPLLRSGLQQILLGTPFDVTKEVPTATAQEPTVLIVAASQFSSHMAETVRQAKDQHSAARIVVLADYFDLNTVQQGREAGVDGFCLTSTGPEVLIKSLELVMLGEPVLPSVLVKAMLDRLSSKPEQKLTSKVLDESQATDRGSRGLSAREAEILGCLTGGAPNKVIARKLDVAEATVKVHVKAILRKIGAANRTQAAMWAMQHLPTQAEASLNA